MKLKKRFVFGLCSAAAASFLFGLNIIGYFSTIRHPDLAAYEALGDRAALTEIPLKRLQSEKSFGIRVTYADAQEAYRKALLMTDELSRIKEIQRIVTDSTVHYFPEGVRNTAMGVPITENYLLWFSGLFTSQLERHQLASTDPYEFLDGAKAWERGAGMCGDLATVAIFLLNGAGIKAGKARLGGHITVVARTSDGREFVVDPDYGFVLEGSLRKVEQEVSRVKQAVMASGHSSKSAQSVSEWYKPPDNVVHWKGNRDYRPKGFFFERAAYVLIWALPILLTICAILLIRRRHGKERCKEEQIPVT